MFNYGLSSKITSGYNGAMANENIRNFASAMSDILKDITTAYNEFIDELYKNWISQKGKEFSSTYNAIMATAVSDAVKESNNIITLAINSVKAIAASHTNEAGNRSAFNYNGGYVSSLKITDKQLRDMDGTFFGIRPAPVTRALMAFKSKINLVLPRIDTIPNGIAVRSASNAVSTLYQNNIDKLKKSLISASTQISVDINKEIENFQQAVEESDKTAMALLDEAFENVFKI